MRIDAGLSDLFDSPPATFGPTPLWWWSAERITRERLEWQMRRFHEGGVDNLVIINLAPAGPLFGAVCDDPQWFSDEWWDRFRDACEIAKSLGMRLWFYDQIGFSGANLQGRVTHEHPWASGQALRATRVSVADGAVALRGDDEALAAYTADGGRVLLGADGRLEDGSHEGAELVLITTHPTAFDYLEPRAVELLLETVHREFDRRLPEYLGNVIAGSFQDELPSTNAWSPRFAEEFARRRGYDLLDHLHSLFGRGDLRAAKVRSDYYAVRAELTQEALFVPLARWHADRGMLLGADQSNPARAGYPLQGTQIYTDYFRTHRWISAAGSDHEGDSKVHSSMAHLYGHERVWLEAFHSSGWGGTLEDTWDWLVPFLRSGANLYNPHASYYSTVGGWFEWAPPSTDWRQPYWAHYPAFSRAVARTMSIMSWGRYEADVAVLHPTATMQALLPLDLAIDHFMTSAIDPAFADADLTQETYLDLCGKNDWFHTRPGALDSAGISFDIIDDDSLQRAASGGGRLRVREQAYSAIVLPSVTFLEEASARALVEFMDDGGDVIAVGQLPRHATGRSGDDAAVARVVDHPRFTHVSGAADAVAALPGAAQYARCNVPLLVRRSGDTSVALVSGAFPNASAYPLRASLGLGRWDDHDFDRTRYASSRTVLVRGVVTQAEVWNPATGSQVPADIDVSSDVAGGGEGVSTITVATQGAPLVLLTWRHGDADEPAAALDACTPEPRTLEPLTLDISDGWSGELVATLDNTFGDLARPVGRPLADPQIWTLSGREEGGEWAPVKVTVGQRVLVHPAGVVTDLPPPLSPAQCEAVVEGTALLGGARWERHQHSASRGTPRDHAGALGTKGMVPTEFILVSDPPPGQMAIVRTLLSTDHRGVADLVVATSADVAVWWNGVELTVTDGYAAVLPVTVDRQLNVLEYRLGASRMIGQMDARRVVGSSFTLVPAGGHAQRPEYMVIGDPLARPDGTITFSSAVPAVGAVEQAQLVIGAATAATVMINGVALARQEKVEYYESEWGANPAFFSHDVTEHLCGSGDVVQVHLETTDASSVLFVDLAIRAADGAHTLVSGAGWECTTAGRTSPSRPDPRQWSPLEAAHAVLRPHPLPQAAWLRGEAQVGSPVVAFDVTDSTVPRRQEFSVLLPAGCRTVTVPLLVAAEVALEGVPVQVHDGVLTLEGPLQRPATLTVLTEPTALHRGGAAWSGPMEVHHETAPIALGDWRDLGLAAWSGGVRYRRTLDVPSGRAWTLDLGDLRGSVDVRVNGVVVGEAFCAPFTVDLEAVDGPVEVEVTVYNTLGPFLHESTPTTWVFPSQLASGLFGPVTLHL